MNRADFGCLRLSEKYGLKPGTTVRIEENANGLHLRRPVTQLARVCIEPTNRCNLAALPHTQRLVRAVGRNEFDRVFRIVEDLKLLPVHRASFGARAIVPSSPRDMVKELSSVFVELITTDPARDLSSV